MIIKKQRNVLHKENYNFTTLTGECSALSLRVSLLPDFIRFLKIDLFVSAFMIAEKDFYRTVLTQTLF